MHCLAFYFFRVNIELLVAFEPCSCQSRFSNFDFEITNVQDQNGRHNMASPKNLKGSSLLKTLFVCFAGQTDSPSSNHRLSSFWRTMSSSSSLPEDEWVSWCFEPRPPPRGRRPSSRRYCLRTIGHVRCLKRKQTNAGSSGLCFKMPVVFISN